MERYRQAWSIIRSVLHEKFSFGVIKGIAGRAGLDLTRMTHLEQTPGTRSASKSQLLSAIDDQVGEMDKQRLDQFLGIVTEEMLRRQPLVEPVLRESLERLNWTLHEGHLVSVSEHSSHIFETLDASKTSDLQINQITEVTRRNIFDAMTVENVNWAGRFGEVEFLGRIFNLGRLPSTDPQFQDAGQDIWQHRINNQDWEADWVFHDPRFDLLHCEDELFLRFLCETIHPLVSNNVGEVDKLLQLYNEHLEVDGFELVEDRRISQRPAFKGKEVSRAQGLIRQIKDMDIRGRDERRMASSPLLKASGEQRYDLFLSYASEDKDAIARPLYEALVAEGVSVWFDEAVLELGDSLRRKIDDGLAKCRYGVVILSHRFLNKEWPQRELDGLVARETASGEKAILPIWHELDRNMLMRYSPPLADRLAGRSEEGIPALVNKILQVLRR